MVLSQLAPHARDFFTGTAYLGAIGMENLLSPMSKEKPRAESINGYHVMYTGPFRSCEGNKPFAMSAHAQWTARLSALTWRRYNGPIHLITDPDGAAYFREIGLDKVYDSIREDLWDPYGLNQKKYWASGKLLALRQLETPCVVLDMDLIVWKPLPELNCSLATAHTEEIDEDFYPGRDYFMMHPRYAFPKDWDYTAEPLNTSLLYISDPQLKEEYLRESFRFMQYDRGTPDNGSICMIFAEQRILAMCAARNGIQPKTFLDYRNLPETHGLITHTWNAKSLLSKEKDIYEFYMQCCREKCEILVQELMESQNKE